MGGAVAVGGSRSLLVGSAAGVLVLLQALGEGILLGKRKLDDEDGVATATATAGLKGTRFWWRELAQRCVTSGFLAAVVPHSSGMHCRLTTHDAMKHLNLRAVLARKHRCPSPLRESPMR